VRAVADAVLQPLVVATVELAAPFTFRPHLLGRAQWRHRRRLGAPDLRVAFLVADLVSLAVVIGGERDEFYSRAIFQGTAEGARNGRLILYSGASHSATFTHPWLADDVAAFLAADEGTPIRMTHLLRAARSEYAKLEKPLTDSEVEGWV